MNFWHFLLAIFAGRMVRFLILSVLVLKFGAQAVALTLTAVLRRWPVLLLLVGAPAELGCGIEHGDDPLKRWCRAQFVSPRHP